MKKQMRAVLNDRALAQSLITHGLKTIQARHTCAHRVTELLNILQAHLLKPATSNQQPSYEDRLLR
jgi:spore maturation protein CgeB